MLIDVLYVLLGIALLLVPVSIFAIFAAYLEYKFSKPGKKGVTRDGDRGD